MNTLKLTSEVFACDLAKRNEAASGDVADSFDTVLLAFVILPHMGRVNTSCSEFFSYYTANEIWIEAFNEATGCNTKRKKTINLIETFLAITFR